MGLFSSFPLFFCFSDSWLRSQVQIVSFWNKFLIFCWLAWGFVYFLNFERFWLTDATSNNIELWLNTHTHTLWSWSILEVILFQLLNIGTKIHFRMINRKLISCKQVQSKNILKSYDIYIFSTSTWEYYLVR